MNKPASLRESMPQTAEWVDRKRAEWGKAHVNDCVRRAIAGEPGYFYAIEGGNVLGTPWPAGTAVDGGPPVAQRPGARKLSVHEVQRMAVLCGASFAGFMREPTNGGGDGAN